MFARTLRSYLLLPAALLLAAAPAIHAEEGMWTFDNPPLKQLAAKYNFHPSQEWLDHLRLSSVRLNDGGSGSFVSPNGLLLTNHHVARGQLQKNSTAEHDYLRDGFYAATPDAEMKSADLEVNVLVAMQDVTAKVQGAAKGIADDAKALKARDAAIAAIEKESKDKTGLRSDVVSFYHGGEYWLYQYRAYTDVRLVFAPEQQAAFYGGDPDNFTYPRYDLDMALFRVYENGKPLHSDNYLKWSAKGAAPGELIFISGHPGSTERQDTMSQLLAERDGHGPAITEYLQRRIAAAQAFAAQGPEQARLVGSTIFGLQNSLKVYLGRAEALSDKAILAKKQAEEDDFRAKVAANPEWQKAYGSAWDTIARVEEQLKPEVKSQIFRRTDSRLFTLALTIVQYVAEVKKPDGERLPQFHDAGLESLKFQLLSPAPVYPSTEKLFMAAALKLGQEKLGKARFLVYGKNAYPDATFTLRLSYGTVDGFPYNGTIAPPFTTFYGLYDRAASFSNKPPFNLTAKQVAGRDKLDLTTPLDFVSTGDIIGGNSGSPVVNRNNELVGLIFDGNIESLAGDFVYEGGQNRAVAVHSAGMIEGLRKLYNAGALADELEGKK